MELLTEILTWATSLIDSLTNLVTDSPVTYLIIFLMAAIDVLVPIIPAEATVTAAKILSKSEPKKAGKIAFRAAVLEGSALSAEDAQALANVPDKDTLRAQLVGALQGPMRALAATLAAVPGGMARVLQARADQGGEAPEADAE